MSNSRVYGLSPDELLSARTMKSLHIRAKTALILVLPPPNAPF